MLAGMDTAHQPLRAARRAAPLTDLLTALALVGAALLLSAWLPLASLAG